MYVCMYEIIAKVRVLRLTRTNVSSEGPPSDRKHGRIEEHGIYINKKSCDYKWPIR